MSEKNVNCFASARELQIMAARRWLEQATTAYFHR